MSKTPIRRAPDLPGVGTMDFDARQKEAERRLAEEQANAERLLAEEQAKQKDRRLAIAKRLEEAWKAHVSPPGAIKGLPPLLEQRRLEYQIPDEAFGRAALFDKVMLFQIPMWEQETYGDTSILMPETGRERIEESAPRAVIVSAGLKALDVLHSHGSGLGHRVQFQHLSPWRAPFMMIAGHELYLLPMRVGDLIDDEDTAAALRSGELELVYDNGHRYRRPEVETSWWSWVRRTWRRWFGRAPKLPEPTMRGDI